MAANQCQIAKDLVAWLDRVHQGWNEIRITAVESDTPGELLVHTEFNVTVRVHLGPLTPQDVTVQIYHGALDPQERIVDYRIVDMSATGSATDGEYDYTGTIPCRKSGLQGYTVRILPFHPDLNDLHVPGLVTWAS